MYIPIIDYSVGLDSILNSTRFLFDDFLLLGEQKPRNDLTQSDVERCYFDALRLQLKYRIWANASILVTFNVRMGQGFNYFWVYFWSIFVKIVHFKANVYHRPSGGKSHAHLNSRTSHQWKVYFWTNVYGVKYNRLTFPNFFNLSLFFRLW